MSSKKIAYNTNEEKLIYLKERMAISTEKFYKETPCWEWLACIHYKQGYGQFMLARKNYRAFRETFIIYKGEIPKGLVLDHLCRNRACCNPDHLEAVTHKENINRGETGHSNKNKTGCPSNHPYDEENTYFRIDHKTGLVSRGCRECRKLRSQLFEKNRPPRKRVRNRVKKK
jgi:hypothetical protein